MDGTGEGGEGGEERGESIMSYKDHEQKILADREYKERNRVWREKGKSVSNLLRMAAGISIEHNTKPVIYTFT